MVVSVNRITDNSLEKYDVLDQSLIPSKDFTRNFGDVNDYVEAHIYTKDNRLLQSDYNYKGYTVPSDISSGATSTVSSLIFDPAAHLQSVGYNAGDFKIDYRVYRKKLFNLAQKTFFINEISSDRKEIRLTSNIISETTVEENTLNFLYEIQTSPYFKDFLLNFGGNNTVNAVNIALDKNTNPFSIVIKLYQPLPAEFDLKSSLWVVEELSDPIQYEVELAPDVVPEVVEFLGPVNFDVNLDSHQAISSTYQSLNSIYSTDSLTAYQNVVNKLSDNSVSINVDYSDYSKFIHFSSAVERLNNFVYKLQTIEDYNASLAVLKSIPNYTSSSVSASVQSIQSNINGIIQKFDGYENYLYNVSESNSWPKTGTYPNYSLYPTTSSVALSWLGSYNPDDLYYGGMLNTASLYDLENQDNLVFSAPEYISTNADNQAYLLFLNMVGQHFDNIWIYIKAINDIHKANNSFTEGISKDMVYTALRSLGIKLYNNNTNENVFDYFIGKVSGSYTVTGSSVVTSGEDRSKELFKRIYHNLPYLLKSKGTTRGIKALISTFGIPDTVLDVIEYGGSDKFSDTLEYVYDRFSYALNNSNGSNFDLKWAPLTQNNIKYGHFTMVPDAIEFKFKPDTSNINNTVTLLQQFNDGVGVVNFGVTMDYTSSNGVPSANINLLMSDTTQYVSSSLTLPVYATGSDGEASWWNVLLKREYKYTSYNILDGEPYDTSSLQKYDLIVKNNISGRIGHQASASIYATGSNSGSLNNTWSDYGDISNHFYLTFGGPSLANSHFPSGSNFNGQFQEVRYWSEPLNTSAFDYHVLNGESYEGNYTGSAFSDLAARFPLGNNLVTYNHSASVTVESVHPNYSIPYSSGSIGTLDGISLYGSAIYGANLYGASGSFPFLLNENKAYFYRFPDRNSYSSLYSYNYTNTPNAGYYSPVSEKIRIVDNSVNGEVLSPILRLEKEDAYRTKDVHFTDVSFSPQNEINKDVIAEYGSTLNVDNLIGNPGTQYDGTYVDLDNLKKNYYAKFFSKFNYNDYIRLIKSVDNTLFKMIEDYVPARANLSTGITIKSPILERNRVKRQKPEATITDLGECVLDILDLNTDTSHTNVDGSIEEFITSELSGSVIDTFADFTKANLNPYLHPTSSINTDLFNISEYNVQQGVVTQNRTSSLYMSVDPGNDEILSVAEIQDDYYTYKRNSLPRYDGCKSTSQLYNVYTPGDSSYGKNAAIDYNVLKFGWVNTILPKNLNFHDKTTLNLKYLIDESGSLTELNAENRNLFEVQNTFKSGDQLTVSLFDKINPTNQSSLSGVKEIFLGGFSYTPILYRDLDETLYFEYLNPTVTESINLGVKAYCTNSFGYEAGADAQRNPLAGAVNINDGYFYTINGSFSSTTGVPMGDKLYSYNAWTYYTSSNVGVNYTNFGSVTPGNTGGDARPNDGNTYSFDLLKFSSLAGGYNTEPNPDAYQVIDGNYYYVAPRSSNYIISGSIQFSFQGRDPLGGYSIFKVVGIVEKSTTPSIPSSWTYVGNTTLTSLGGAFGTYDSATNTIAFDDEHYSDWTLALNAAISTSLTAGTYVRFKFYFLDIAKGLSQYWPYFKFTLNRGSSFEIFDSNTHISRLITTGSIGQIPSIFTYDTGSTKGIIFNDSASFQFYDKSVFLPQTPYSNNYSPVYETFDIQTGDLVRFGGFTSPTAKYFEVDSVTTSPNVKVTFVATGSIDSGVIDPEAFAILRKIPDETSVLLNFNKLEGETSKALIISHNLDKRIAAEVANIIQPLKVSLGAQ